MPGQLGRRVTIGRLRHRVIIQDPAPAKDEFGQMQPGWADVATVRAEVAALSGKELFASGGVQANATHRVRMRYRGGLKPSFRLLWLDTSPAVVLNVVAVLPSVGTSNLLEVWCRPEE